MTADEILEQMANNPELYAADPEEICVIDNDLRTISIPSSVQLAGVESDEDVRCLYFQMPKQYHEVDLSGFNIRINFMNANNQGDVYAVTDKAISGDNITFSWLVGRNALAYRGNIRFIVCLKKTDAEGVVQQEFNTTIAQLTVLEGLETTEAVVAENPDIIEQILQRLDDLEENGGGGGTPGKDGREIELQNSGTAIQWRYKGDDEWTDLVQLSDLKGEKGDKGDKGDTGDTGPQGPTGETGPQGPVGPAGKDGAQGPKGDTGEQGSQGPKGDTGATPNIQIGTVQTLDPGQQATASMTGTAENPLINLGIPKGEKGDPGESTGDGSYTLPIMSETQLGGGKAVSKTDEDVPVAVDPSTGQLFVPTYPSGGDSGGKSYYYEETLEEGIAKVFVPFSEFKGCKRIFAQIYIPDVSEESYNNYIPRAKIDNKDAWASGKTFASRTITANLNNVVIFGELVLNNSDAFFAGGGSRAQYTNQTVSGLNAATYGDKFTFNESETSGIYFEIHNRTNYSFPAGTKIIVVGM